jgi:hypothetical protein
MKIDSSKIWIISVSGLNFRRRYDQDIKDGQVNIEVISLENR